tara:strand:+ start:1240 stop:2466 length:1227 start_codon:yes stop_codon:yes gene_type:complete
MSEINLTHSNGNQVKLTTPDTLSASKTFKLPNADGSSGDALITDGSGALSFATVSDYSHRNMIINGGMMVSQRGLSAAITGGSNTVPLIDRYMAVANSSMTYNVTISQEDDHPFGLGKSFKSLTTSAKTPSGSENYIIRTKLEEQDIRRIGFGTSGCKKTTLTFWVKSNKTGTYSVMIAISGFSINLLTSYTISAQNTWEKKTISIPAYTTSYTHPDDTGAGFTCDWHLSSGPDDLASAHSWQTSANNARAVTGQVNILDAVNNYWQLANVQYEVGEVSTPFEHRTYTDELLRCQRYFTFVPSGTVFPGRGNSGSSYIYSYQSTVPMRRSPTIGVSNDIAHGTFSVRRYRDGTGVSDSTSTPTTSSTYFSPNSNMIHLIQGGFSGADDRSATLFVSGGAITISAEYSF